MNIAYNQSNAPTDLRWDEKQQCWILRTVNPEPAENTSVSIGKSHDIGMTEAIELEDGDLVKFTAKESKA